MSWAGGIALALGAFSPLYAMLVANGIMKIFGGGIGPDDFAKAIRTISMSIVDSANYFAGVKASFTGGPTKEWAEGVGTAIGAFSPVYAALMRNNFWNTKVSAEDMSNGIITISNGIISAAKIFSDNKAIFDISRIPTVEWGKNVGSVLQAFAPIFKYMNEQSGWFTSGREAAEDLSFGITSVINTIVKVAEKISIVSANVWNSYPSKEWIVNITRSVIGFIALSKGIDTLTFASISKVSRVTNAIISVAKKIHDNNKFFSKGIDPNYMNNLSKNVIGFAQLAKTLNELDVTNPFKSMFGMDPISQAANGMIKIAGAYDKLAIALNKFGSSLQSIDGTKVDVIRRLTGNLAILASMNQDSFSTMMQTLENKASVFGKLAEIDTERIKTVNVGDVTRNISTPSTINKSNNNDTGKQLDMVIALLTKLNIATGGLDDFIESKGKEVSLNSK